MALWLNLSTRIILLIIGFIDLTLSIIVDALHEDTVRFAYAGIVLSIFANLCDVIPTCITRKTPSWNPGIMLTLDAIALGLLIPGFLVRTANTEYFINTSENIASQWLMIALAGGHGIMTMLDTAYCFQMMQRKSQQRKEDEERVMQNLGERATTGSAA